MREYKFRGMDISGDWHYGNLAIITKKMGLTDPGYYISNAAGKPFAYMVRPETVGQYVGLPDRIGKEIFDLDLLKIKGHPFHGLNMQVDGIYEVGYNERMELCCGSWLLHRMLPYITVVGNKFDNPDLLEVPHG